MNLPVGTKVTFSVFPYFRKVPGVVVDGGVEIMDKDIRDSLEDDNIALIAQWENIVEIEEVK